jgi:hypothetical protein
MRYAHQRFESMIDQAGKCWLWKGCKKDGYGYMMTGSRSDGTRRKIAAHVFSYRYYNGPIPPGMVVYRKCTTTGCVNPEHLRVGTRGDMVRMALKHGTWKQGNALSFPNTAGENNGRSKLTNDQRRAILLDKGRLKVIVLARRNNVTEQTIYRLFKGLPKTEAI